MSDRKYTIIERSASFPDALCTFLSELAACGFKIYDPATGLASVLQLEGPELLLDERALRTLAATKGSVALSAPTPFGDWRVVGSHVEGDLVDHTIWLRGTLPKQQMLYAWIFGQIALKRLQAGTLAIAAFDPFDANPDMNWIEFVRSPERTCRTYIPCTVIVHESMRSRLGDGSHPSDEYLGQYVVVTTGCPPH